MNHKALYRTIRHRRIRARIRSQESERPRLIVFRSLKHIYAQLVDDLTSKTLASASDVALKGKMTKKEKARMVGKQLAEKAVAQKITACVFDRAGYKYHGRVKELAEGARENGLQF